uniref:Inositol oxygenase n=1 Tax=Rhabditophanes sp. KR3021 TaxID=114890 RepID=A0AC35TTM3_9BILA
MKIAGISNDQNLVQKNKETVSEEAGSEKLKFRHYDAESKDPVQIRVCQHYYNQHKFQTVDFVKKMHKKWLCFEHASLSIMDCLNLLNDLVDESDPDTEDANVVHAFQTAERLRQKYPELQWLHLAGLIHDMGKVMSVWGEAQYAVTGDTYPVGCYPAASIVYGIESFIGNGDINNPEYNTELGMYEEKCGIDKLLMTWSHDEYLYQVLTNHAKCSLPYEALFAIRFHSFYPYHSFGEYTQFETEENFKLRPAIDMLNSCDLYSKYDEKPDIDALKPYYQSLIDKYIPGIIKW